MTFLPMLHDWKIGLIATLGTTDDMMHVHVGLALYVIVQLVQGTRRGSMFALNVVVTAEVLNELIDRLVKGAFSPDTPSDVVLTLMWPVIITAVSQYRRARWGRSQQVYDALVRSAVPARQQLPNLTDPRQSPL
jgi:hypothetical protein